MNFNFLNRLRIKWMDTEKPHKLEWGLLAVVCLVLLPNFFYNDIIITTRHSINLWHCLADGNSIFDFYRYNSLSGNLQTYPHIPSQGCAYSFAVYLTFAIWNLPLFFIERFSHINIFNNSFIVIYSKTILIVALIFSAIILKQICKELGWSDKKSLWAVYYYLSSALVISCILVVGQYDIFSVCFTLLGVLSYLKNDRYKFLFWFSVAFMFKLFAFIVFVPLVLLKEKRIFKVIKYVIASLIPLLILNLTFKVENSQDSNLESMLFSSWFSRADLSFANYNISFFVISLTILCIFSHILQPKTNEMFLTFAIYISALAYFCFFMFIPAYPYWYILMSPFLTLTVFMNNKYFKLNSLLEMIGLFSLFSIQQISGAYWCFSYKLFIPTFWKNFFNLSHEIKPKYTHEILNVIGAKLGFTDFTSIACIFLGSIFIAAMMMLIVINYPKKVIRDNKLCDDILIERSIVHSRNLLNFALGIIPIIVFIFNVVYYNL